MRNKSVTRLSLAAVVALSLVAAPKLSHAWGGVGHTYVARLAVASLPRSPLSEMLKRNETWLATASSHPDRWRNRPDNAEAPRHFLDAERFGFGTDLSRVPRPFADVLKVRSYDQLRSDGMNPWTVRRTYQLLVDALKKRQWDNAMVHAAYLSHYIGDAHVPFHASENYDGQLSVPSQKGIHARFESVMLERSVKFEELAPGSPIPFVNPMEQSFATLQASVDMVPGVLAADRRAQTIAGDTQSESYWALFTARAKPIAISRLQTGGRALAGALESAWIEAGRPSPPRDFVMTDALLPYAPKFVARGEVAPPAQPLVTAEEKAAARLDPRVSTIKFSTPDMGELPAIVLLPKDYERNTKTRYPVLYLLHGATGNYKDWLSNSGVAAYTKDLPLIVVLLDAHGDSFYQDTPRYGKWETFFGTTLLPEIDTRYRTINKREGRVIAGLSMGGYGAWRLALNYPDRFAAAASLSGAIGYGDPAVPDTAAGLARMVFPNDPDGPKKVQAGALLPRVEKLVDRNGKYTGPALYFDCGKDDFLIAWNRNMERAFLERAIPYEYAEFDGAHTWEYWDAHIRDAMNFLLRQLNGTR